MIIRKYILLLTSLFFLMYLIIYVLIIFDWNILPKFYYLKKSQQNSFNIIQKSKFVSFECHMDSCGGLADRFKGIMNAYAWSIFTNRNFIINISQPCNIENLIIPNKVNWHVNFNDLRILKSYNKKTQFEIRKINDFKFRDNLINLNILNYQLESDIIKIYTNLEWFSSYSKNRYI